MAAEALCIEVSTASKSLTTLEHDLGFTLIQRSTRSLKITASGLEAYEHMKDIIERLDSFIDKIMEKKNYLEGVLRIAAPTIVCELLLSDWIYEFQKVHLQTSFYLHAADRYDDINPNDYDLILHPGHIRDDSLVHHQMDNVILIICASHKYVVEHPPICHPKDLLNKDILTLWNHTVSDSVTLTKGDESFILTPKPRRFVTNNLYSQFSLMLKGSGITVSTPSWLAINYLDDGEVVRLLPEWKIPELPVYLAWKKKKYYSALFNEFIKFIEKSWHERPKIIEK